MNFEDFCEQLQSDIDKELLVKFSYQPNVIYIVAELKSYLILSSFSDIDLRLSVITTSYQVFASCVVTYFYSVEAYLDPAEHFAIYDKLIFLSKLLFQYELEQLPLSFYTAFSCVATRYLECFARRSEDDVSSLNSCLRYINFQNAYDEIESCKYICNLLRDTVGRFYSVITQSTIDFAIDFLSLYNDNHKLIEIFSLKYFTARFGKNEQYAADAAYKAFNTKIAEIAVSEDQEDADEQLQLLTHYYLTYAVQAVQQLQQIGAEKYIVDFLLKTQHQKVDSLMQAVVQNKLTAYKQLAVIISHEILRRVLVGNYIINCGQITRIVEALTLYLTGNDEGFFCQMLYLAELVITAQTTFLHPQSDVTLTPQLNGAVYSALKQATLYAIKDREKRNHFAYFLMVYVLLPLLSYIAMLKLSTHNGFVSTQIQVRKQIVEFYGQLLLNVELSTALSQMIGGGTGDYQKKFQKVMNTDNISPPTAPNPEVVECFKEFVINAKLRSENLLAVLKHILPKTRALLGRNCSFRDFLLQEALFRLYDESQYVKKLAAEQALQIVEQDRELTGILFTDLLYMQNSESFLFSVFDEHVLRPLYDQPEGLVRFLEGCPTKLFESIFAGFFKDRTVPTDLIDALLKINRPGAHTIIFYILQYTQPLPKKIKTSIVHQLQQHMLVNHETDPGLNTRALTALSCEQLIDCVDFDMEPFIVAYNRYPETAELLNRIRTDILVQRVSQSTDKDHEIGRIVSYLTEELATLSDQISTAYSSEQSLSIFLQDGSRVLFTSAFLAQKQLLSDAQIKQLARGASRLLTAHPLAAFPAIFFIYAMDDVEFRLTTFDALIQALSRAPDAKTANNLLIAALSAVYGFPDELGQFIDVLAESAHVRTSHVAQRHFLYVVIDLERLNLIKMSPDLFCALFNLLLSPNSDLYALAERLLLTPQYSTHFVQNFTRAMQQMRQSQVSEEARAIVYAKVLYGLPQTAKYQLLNIIFYYIYKYLLTNYEQHIWFFEDVLGIVHSGAVQVQVGEDWQRADKILKRLNAQYSVNSVLPRLFDCLAAFNRDKFDVLYEKAVYAIRSVCHQMKVGYNELLAYFGDAYCTELVQVRW